MTWTPQSGDVAYFTGCVDGGDPYRVTVSYRHATSGWHNIESGLRLDDDHPGLANLYLLVRDHHAITTAPQLDQHLDRHLGDGSGPAAPAALTFPTVPVAHLGLMPLVLSFEPDAIREHFDEDMDMSGYTDQELAEVGLAALSDDTLYGAFHDTLKWALTTIEHDPPAGNLVAGEDAHDPGELKYLCTYAITSLMDDRAEAVAEGEVVVYAHHAAGAVRKATEWVQENDPHFDERIDPRVNITNATRAD